MRATQRRRLGALLTVGLAALALPLATGIATSSAANPTSVTIAGSLQSEVGCPGDWDPTCATTHLTYDATDDVWQGTWAVPAGSYEYKAALNDSWDVNYGKNAALNGENIPVSLGAPTSVKFFYDDKRHWITDNVSSVIAVAPGSFQSELGCPGDWDPSCLRSWLQDPDGDGTYTFETTALPAGSYEGKVALNELWEVNYGQDGIPGGANIGLTVPANGSTTTFRYDSASHILTITSTPPGPGPDNDVAWDGLRHDSRGGLYRTPGGAVPAGTPVTLRFRTFHNDVTSVKARVFSLNAGGAQLLPMSIVASNVSCEEAGLENDGCDYWAVTLPDATPDNLWYRFIVTDGTKTVYYADNTSALDGGLGAPSESQLDNSWALMVSVPGFQAPTWAKDAVIYQIFPDRFRNGRANNDPNTGDIRYDDPVQALGWGTLPEGYCRNYTDAANSCPWRFDSTPPADSPTKEQPRGRDYQGGDLKGIDQQLDYLKSLGVNTLYLNPIFDAGSNHGYDTQDYYKVDPYFGTQKDWDNLAKHADHLGVRIILDGVFNHLSSDSPIFDRYGHYSTVGACESTTSPYRSWFNFRPQTNGPCAGPAGPKTMTYDGWFGFDSIPVINKSLADVQGYFLTSSDSVTKHWLRAGAAAWRLDVEGDASFPTGYWETFRQEAKATKSDALLIGELWQKDSTLLRNLRGDRMDSTMNYRLRDAIVGLLAPGPFDSKGFADSGRIITPTEFGNRVASLAEDYPDTVLRSLMNLLDSHDTERILWTLTPGADNPADKQANVAQGKQRLRLATLIQFAMPGAPTVYYGDEAGVTGDDDPDDRRAFPWADKGGTPDTALQAWYRSLTAARTATPALRDGDLRVLLADDAANTVALGRKTTSGAAVVVINRSNVASTVQVPVAGYLPDGTALQRRLVVGGTGGGTANVSAGVLSVAVPALGGVLLTANGVDLLATAAPANLRVTDEGNGTATVIWNAVPGAAGYQVLSSFVSGGYLPAPGTSNGPTSFTLTGLRNATPTFIVVRALDAIDNVSSNSNEAVAVPHFVLGWANLQWPPTLNHLISVTDRTDTVYGQVWIDGVTEQPGATPSLQAQLGFGPSGSNPANNPAWSWIDAGFNTNAGNNDEFKASLLPEKTGAFDYVYRYSTTGGRDWLYADLNGPIPEGALPPNPGKLTVNSSGDTTAPAVPTNLTVVSANPAGIALMWGAIAGDPSLYGYEVLRSDTPGGPYTVLARVTAASYTDTSVAEGATYSYVVRSIDGSFNRSDNSAQVTATAELRTVTLQFNVTVPATTDGAGNSVFIAGLLDRLDGGLPQWNPSGVSLTRVDATHWQITLTGRETTQIEYKYALGSWDFVEKDNACGEVANRQLTLAYGATGTQTVNDIVQNWRNVAPCGN
jgi:glycosidase